MDHEDVFADMCVRMKEDDIEDIFKERINNKYTTKQLDIIKNIIINLSKLKLKDRKDYDKPKTRNNQKKLLEELKTKI